MKSLKYEYQYPSLPSNKGKILCLILLAINGGYVALAWMQGGDVDGQAGSYHLVWNISVRLWGMWEWQGWACTSPVMAQCSAEPLFFWLSNPHRCKLLPWSCQDGAVSGEEALLLQVSPNVWPKGCL